MKKLITPIFVTCVVLAILCGAHVINPPWFIKGSNPPVAKAEKSLPVIEPHAAIIAGINMEEFDLAALIRTKPVEGIPKLYELLKSMGSPIFRYTADVTVFGDYCISVNVRPHNYSSVHIIIYKDGDNFQIGSTQSFDKDRMYGAGNKPEGKAAKVILKADGSLTGSVQYFGGLNADSEESSLADALELLADHAMTVEKFREYSVQKSDKVVKEILETKESGGY